MADLVFVLSGPNPKFMSRHDLESISVTPSLGDFVILKGVSYKVVRAIIDIDTGDVHIGLEYSRDGVPQLS